MLSTVARSSPLRRLASLAALPSSSGRLLPSLLPELPSRAPRPSPSPSSAYSHRRTLSFPAPSPAAPIRRGSRSSKQKFRMPSNNRPTQERPPCPANEGMTVIDRSKFTSSLDVLAVKVAAREVGVVTKQLMKSADALSLTSLKAVLADESSAEHKWCLLATADSAQLAPETRALLEGREVGTRTVELTYDFWTTAELIHSILPKELHADAPQGFSKAGHLIHLNLRPRYLPFKHAIAEIFMSKNSGVRTVVNKIDTINESEFRTFPMEVLAGPAEFVVSMSESNCEFQFDFSKVYWNSRLSHEHERLIELFQKGDIVADVMAGVGPFVVPAAKRGCFVFANDLNPESTAWMDVNRKKNHISEDTLRISTLDGKAFIQSVVGAVGRQPFQPIELNAKGEPMTKTERDRANSERIKRQAKSAGSSSPPPQHLAAPRLLRPSSPYIKHFIMNLPATAVTFLGAFRGSYAGLDDDERARVEMPTVHCHYFDKSPGVAEGMTDEKAEQALRELASHYLGHPITLDSPGYYLHKVRLVAPNKWMYCIGFELPREVAFARD